MRSSLGCRGRRYGRKLNCIICLLFTGCEPTLIVGEWQCAAQEDATSALDFPTPTDELTLPFRSGFENGFCDYADPSAFCYANQQASYRLVDEPVHSGSWAASFQVVGEEEDGLQARCVRQGRLPEAAYYGAWFYIQRTATSSNTWNLFHFEGRDPANPTPTEQHGLWDVSLQANEDGSLDVYIFDFLRMRTLPIPEAKTIPIRTWFHLEVYWNRSFEPTGSFDLYVDGELALSLKDLRTDDSELGQWYVGNFAAAISPSPNTLVMDDVTIAAERQGG